MTLVCSFTFKALLTSLKSSILSLDLKADLDVKYQRFNNKDHYRKSINQIYDDDDDEEEKQLLLAEMKAHLLQGLFLLFTELLKLFLLLSKFKQFLYKKNKDQT